MKQLLIAILITVSTARADDFRLLSVEAQHDKQMALPVCIGIGVVIVGGTAVIVTLHYCKKWFGTNDPAKTNKITVELSEDGANWMPTEPQTNRLDKFEWHETNSIGLPQRFYRVRLESASN